MLNQFIFVGTVKDIHTFPAITLLTVECIEEPNKEVQPTININITNLATSAVDTLEVGDMVATKCHIAGGSPVELVAQRVIIIKKGCNKDGKKD